MKTFKPKTYRELRKVIQGKISLFIFIQEFEYALLPTQEFDRLFNVPPTHEAQTRTY